MVTEAPDGAVIGSAAALREIGGPDDRNAEVFGVAVEVGRRYRGIGTALVRRLVEELYSARPNVAQIAGDRMRA